MTTLAYLATPYTRYPKGIYEAWRDAARLSAKLFQAGVINYSPIVHCHPLALYAYYDDCPDPLDPLDYPVWREHNRVLMEHCDALVIACMDGWRDSVGMKEEIAFFENARKPIFYLDPETIVLTRRSETNDQEAATN